MKLLLLLLVTIINQCDCNRNNHTSHVFNPLPGLTTLQFVLLFGEFNDPNSTSLQIFLDLKVNINREHLMHRRNYELITFTLTTGHKTKHFLSLSQLPVSS